MSSRIYLLLLLGVVSLSACSPLMEPPQAGTEQVSQPSIDPLTIDLTKLNSSQRVGDRFYEITSPVRFSYVPPEGWTALPPVQSGLTTWIGPEQSTGEKVSLRFQGVADDHTSTEVAKGFLDQLPVDQMEITIVEEGIFFPQAGGDAYQIQFTVVEQGVAYHSEWYAFSNGGFILSAYYYRLENEIQEQDALIEECMKTLRVEQ